MYLKSSRSKIWNTKKKKKKEEEECIEKAKKKKAKHLSKWK